MADNYLEKQYQEYQARKAAWENERKYGKIKPRVKRPQTSTITEEKKEE